MEPVEAGGGTIPGWALANIIESFVNVVRALAHPALWLNWSDPAAIMRFAYYGGSVQFFFVVFTLFLILTGIGLASRRFMWGMVIGLEALANTLGRVVAWVGLLMVVQQIVIIFVQRVFASAQISFGFGTMISHDVSWWSEQLKLYNAMIVALCATWTYVQGGHVRVDLVYAVVRYRTRKIIDIVGALVLMMPMATLIWMYGWFFMWRHLITPKISASDKLELMLKKARIVKWNVETIGFSPNGFDAYFLFKILLVAFAGLVFLQAMAVVWRSWLELVEGEAAEGRYLDKDRLGDPQSERAAEIH
ncbi:TRAP transporter small permease subunit [Tropicimonas sp. IMCC34043]|uniref:TRAP transporter small permease subunit n=1 Tax=Tropicimonas sp. IMCC34043 TaxID=2248760 RepID=UPI000E21CFD6|nr:TRAP transporter small permease subunit [Tropicimonas sp. IMCC34043]